MTNFFKIIVITLYTTQVMSLLQMENKAKNLSSYRQLIIFGIEKNKLLVQQQLQLLNSFEGDVKERSLKIIVPEKGSHLSKKYNVKADEYTVILVGKDGTEKHRTNQLIQPQELFALIDAMPMRKAEMQKIKY